MAESPTSICRSDESLDDLPSTLATEELLLAINKEASQEDLERAISRCKDLVLESEQCSVERKWLVRHLIELRLRLQEYKDALADPEHPWNKTSGICKRSIKGHHLQLQSLLRSSVSKYCDHCTGTIWNMIQAWYECQDCGYSCHHKCLALILRECAHVIASERGAYELEICPELGMSAQKYRCAECNSPFNMNLPKGLSFLARYFFPERDWSEPRRCDYNGLYYCTACHWGSTAIVPARVVHNWDFNPYSVCQASLQLLRITATRPLIKLESLNPKLFSLIPELNLVKRLRGELNLIRKYLIVCRFADENRLLWKTIDFPYLIDNIDMYSLQDLVDTYSGDLLLKLQNLIEVFTKHIKTDCEICKGRGHICEICSNVEVLYPFDSTAFVCNECNGVFHNVCFNKKNACPRCKRFKLRQESLETEDC